MGPERSRPTLRSERGETLIEVLVAIVILAAVGIAGYAGLTTAFRSSTDQRLSGQGETLLRSASEWIQSPDRAYVPKAGCPAAGQYSLPALPAGSTGYSVTITAVQFWTGLSAPTVTTPANNIAAPTFSSTCPATDNGLQLVTVTVTAPSGKIDSLSITKRENDAPPGAPEQ